MNEPLQILLVEDNPDDEYLIILELQKHGVAYHCERAESKREFVDQLERRTWDIVITDYYLPGFSGLEALSILRQLKPLSPCILISGSIGEELAAESIKSGANDYLLKQNLSRLVPSIHRAIAESTERREHAKVEAALSENRQQLELIVNSVSDLLICISCSDGRWLINKFNTPFATRYGELVFGISADQILGSDIKVFERVLMQSEPENIDWFDAKRQLAMERRKQVSASREFRTHLGSLFFEVSFIPILDTDGVPIKMLVDFCDRTAQIRAEEQERSVRDQLIQSQKLEALGTLAGGMAHDFNNLLTGIFGFAELAKEATDIVISQRYCEEITQVANCARDLIGRILAFSRSAEVVRRPLCLSDLLIDVYSLVKVTLPSSVKLELKLPKSGPMILGDRNRLQQVVLNLCNNSIHALVSGGNLEIAIDETVVQSPVSSELSKLAPGKYAVLSISDSGIGMSTETLRRAFEPFFTTKPLGQGTGLGLSVTHSIVLDHEGAIRICSVINQGTTVEVYFPIVANNEDVFTPTQEEVLFGKGKKVLCVDDDPVIVRTAAQMLNEMGFVPVTFTDPSEACFAFYESPSSFVAVLTDNNMPGMSGLEFAAKISSLRPNLPVILATGRMESQAMESISAAHFRRVLTKPFSLAQLASEMVWALSHDLQVD
jgi:signal transduction histidine kinase/DNA-binding response OmpR family regulator